MIDKNKLTSQDFTRLEANAVSHVCDLARTHACYYAKEHDVDAATLAILWQALEQEAIRQNIPMNVTIGVQE